MTPSTGIEVTEKSLPHGCYTTYTNHKCRCPECKEANRAYWLNWNRTRKPRVAYCSHQQWRFHAGHFSPYNGGKYLAREICVHCNKTRTVKRLDVEKYIHQLRNYVTLMETQHGDVVKAAKAAHFQRQLKKKRRNLKRSRKWEQ